MGEKYKQLTDKPVSAQTLHGYCLLFLQNIRLNLEKDQMYRKYKSIFGQSDEEFGGNIAIGDALSLANLVIAGIGIGVLPDQIADYLVNSNPGKLYMVSCTDLLGSYELLLNYSKSRKPSRQAMNFINYLIEEHFSGEDN